MSEAIQPAPAEDATSAKAPATETPLPAPAAAPEPAPVRLRCAARGVKKSFGATSILKGVDLEIPEGSFAVLVGPSGCGKSTLLRLVAGLEEADEGTITLAGRDVTHAPPRDRDVAMVFQSYALYPHLSVRDNLKFGLELRGTPRAEIDKRLDEASAMLGLGPLLERLPKQLSGGQRQRVAMGRAIVRRPTIFLFDEPLSNLDAALRAEVRVEIRRLHDRLHATTLYVTHDQVEAMTLGNRIVVMKDGVMMQVDSPLNLYDYPQNKFVAGFIGSPSMNFLTARVQGGQFVVGNSRVAPRGPLAESIKAYEGKEVFMGIRPEHIGVRGMSNIPEGENMLQGKVMVVEPLGAQTDFMLEVNGQTLVAKVEGHAHIKPGDVVDVIVDNVRLHAFDTSTELAIDRGQPMGTRGQADSNEGVAGRAGNQVNMAKEVIVTSTD